MESEAETIDISIDQDIEHTVVDVDAHYSGTFEDLADYINDGPWKDRFKSAVQAPFGTHSFWPKISGRSRTSTRRPRKGSQPTDGDIPSIMDNLQIDKIIFLGDNVITFDQLEADDERPVVYANAYVDYVLDRVVNPAQGIYATVPVPYQEPDKAAELVDRVADEPGIAGLCFITSMPKVPAGNRRYDVIYEAAQHADLPILMHGGTPGPDNFYLPGYEYHSETHTLGFLWANTSQIVSIVAQGVPEKFPDLDFVFQECGLFYVPMMMYRMDAEYLKKPDEASPLLEKLPSEYMKEFYYSTQPLEHVPNKKYFKHIIEMIGGAERIMYASDYPHGDYDVPTAITSLPLSNEEKRAILGTNAEEVFGI